MSDITVSRTDNIITISKNFEAAPEQVFEMFKDPDMLEQWWGPEDWPSTIESFDFKEGGKWHYYMTGPDDKKEWGVATFQEIDEPNSLTFIDAFANEAGEPNEGLPQGKVTFVFGKHGDGTTLTMTGQYASEEEAKQLVEMGMVEGMKQTWKHMEEMLEQSK